MDRRFERMNQGKGNAKQKWFTLYLVIGTLGNHQPNLYTWLNIVGKTLQFKLYVFFKVN